MARLCSNVIPEAGARDFAQFDRPRRVIWGSRSPAEGIQGRRPPRLDRFSLPGRRGFVSDDAAESALVDMCLARHPSDRARPGARESSALARNVALFPVVLVHAFRVLASRMTG
jgi:hypothetical protein